MPEGLEIPQHRLDRVWEAGCAGDEFPTFEDKISAEELEALKHLYLLAQEEANQPSLSDLFASEPYEPEEEINSGGFGTVYRGRSKSTKGRYAIKILKKEFAIERTFREGRATANLSSPYLVRYHHIGELPDGSTYLVMDMVEGTALSEYTREGKTLREDQALPWMKQVCEGMSIAAMSQIIHRDLKPSNILIDSGRNEVRICDFGLARRITAKNSSTSDPEDGTKNLNDQESLTFEALLAGEENRDLFITESIDILGTPAYVAPEQARDSRQATEQSDIYSFGASFYHLLTGKLPTGDLGIYETLRIHRAPDEKVPVPEEPGNLNPELSAEISALIMHCLENDPDRRPRSFKEIRKELRNIEAPRAYPNPFLQELLDEADQALETSHTELAKAYYSKAIGGTDNSAKARFGRGRAHLEEGRMARKSGDMDKAEKSFKMARKDFERALDLKPEYPIARTFLDEVKKAIDDDQWYFND